jgi:hypothetical protein
MYEKYGLESHLHKIQDILNSEISDEIFCAA